MDKIKSLVKGTLASTPTEVIFWGDPTKQTFEQTILQFKSSNREGKKEIIDRIFKKLNRKKNVKTTLSILYFLSCIMEEGGAKLTLGNIAPQVDLSQCENEKERVSQKKFIEVYYQYLKKVSLKQFHNFNVTEHSLSQALSYCQIALQIIISIIRVQFLVNYNLRHSQHQVIVRMICSSILGKVSQDTKVINSFLSKYEELITMEHQFSFHINEIYQKFLFCNKNYEKLNLLKKLLFGDFQFAEYPFDKEKNKRFEKEMLKRKEEKKQFRERQIHSMPVIRSQKEIEMKEPVEIDEEEILIQNDQFIL